MRDDKFWLFSRRAAGSIITLFSLIAGRAGVAIAEEDIARLVEGWVAIGELLGILLLVVGGLRARKRLRLSLNPPAPSPKGVHINLQ